MIHRLLKGKRKIIKKIALRCIDLIVLFILFFVGVNYSIIYGTRKDIVQVEDVKVAIDAVIILGASVQ
jgi:hypothetical protein